MKATAPAAVSERAVTEAGTLSWINKEAIPVLKQLRQAINFKGIERQTLQTTGATTTTIWSQVMPEASAWHIEYLIMGVQSDGSNQARYHETKLLKRTTAVPTTSASVSIEADFEDVAGWAFAFDASSADGTISLTVTGAAATTVNWSAYVQVFEAIGT